MLSAAAGAALSAFSTAYAGRRMPTLGRAGRHARSAARITVLAAILRKRATGERGEAECKHASASPRMFP